MWISASPTTSIRQRKRGEKIAVMLVRGIERRSRTIVVPATRLALLTPEIFQLAVERIACRHKWTNAIQKREQPAKEEW